MHEMSFRQPALCFAGGGISVSSALWVKALARCREAGPRKAIYYSKSALGRVEEFFEARICDAGTLAHVGTGAPARPVEQSSTVFDVAHSMAVLNTTREGHDFSRAETAISQAALQFAEKLQFWFCFERARLQAAP
jgi:hypothetical protein